MRPSDFDDMLETFYSFFAEAEADPSFGLSLYHEKPSIEDERKWFSDALKRIEARNYLLLVAEVDSHVIGWCDVERVAPKTPADHRGSLGVCVKKEYRGRGIGKALLKATIEECRGRFESLELTVLSNNNTAILLYKDAGFRKIGEIPDSIKRAGRYFDEDIMFLKMPRVSVNLSVRESKIHGLRVFSNREFAKGEVVLEIDDSDPVPDRSKVTHEQEIHIDVFVGADGKERVTFMKSPEKYINTSCDPNVYSKTGMASGVRRAYALKDIHEGEEVT